MKLQPFSAGSGMGATGQKAAMVGSGTNVPLSDISVKKVSHGGQRITGGTPVGTPAVLAPLFSPAPPCCTGLTPPHGPRSAAGVFTPASLPHGPGHVRDTYGLAPPKRHSYRPLRPQGPKAPQSPRTDVVQQQHVPQKKKTCSWTPKYPTSLSGTPGQSFAS